MAAMPRETARAEAFLRRRHAGEEKAMARDRKRLAAMREREKAFLRKHGLRKRKP